MSYTMRVSSLDHAPTQASARVTNCDKCCIRLSKWELHIINFMDFLFGVLLLSFGVKLFDKMGSQNFENGHVGWLCWLVTLLGVMLILCCLLSVCGLTGGESYRCCVTPSAWLGVFVGVFSLITAGCVYGFKTDIYSSLNTQGSSLGLDPNEIADIKSWYVFIPWVLFGSFITEVLRFRASSHFRQNINKMDGEFDGLLAEEDRAYANKMANNSASREEKYSNLRQHYKSKYQAPSGTNTGTGDVEKGNTSATGVASASAGGAGM